MAYLGLAKAELGSCGDLGSLLHGIGRGTGHIW